MSILLLTTTTQSGFSRCIAFCTTSEHVLVVYDVGKVSVPVASAIFGLENVAIQLPDTCESVIVCFMISFSFRLICHSAEAFRRKPFGGSLSADVCNVAPKIDNASRFTNCYNLCGAWRE